MWPACQRPYVAHVMRTSHAWIQPHPHGVMLRYILNTVNLILCSFTNYLKNRLPPNDLIIVRNHRDEEEDVQDTKDVLEIPRDMHNKVEIETNSEFQSLTLNPTYSPKPPSIQIDARCIKPLIWMLYIYAWKYKEISFTMQAAICSTQTGVARNR
jgi:hypothetical protein